MISFFITVCDEFRELNRLINQLKAIKNKDDEVIVVYDSNKVTDDVINVLQNYDNKFEGYSYLPFDFKGNFSDYKNYGGSLCNRPWIFQIDADEYLSTNLSANINNLIQLNSDSDIDLIALPRVNIVKGITQRHIDMWGWAIGKDENYSDSYTMDIKSEEYLLLKNNNFIISEQPTEDSEKFIVRFYPPIINYPDYQTRLYKNKDSIKWEGKLHEKIVGFNTYSMIPIDNDLDLLHFKDIDRQERQNNYYKTL